ncbi:GvpL/GvpF family gas vesicle protein [Brevibacillus dissolubilis]|uniref:GvpL/GvpF family gas vesicle protein n=1 Tax=Brevibacillus dissolubilis TaxID=1844116 RepID=UPI00159B8453|nr:GvpL/GvpF family gas vesicle protein [Brevibacillus dissolubilis]
MSDKQAVYVFCAIEESQPKSFGNVTMDGALREVYAIVHQNVAMVACQVDGQVVPSKENMLAHQETIGKIMNQYCVIPMSFGNVFHSEADAFYVLTHIHDQFATLFPQLHGKIEVGLKVVAHKDWLQQEISQDPQIQALRQQVNGKSEEASYYDRIKLGDYAQQFVESLRSQAEQEIYDSLTALSESAKMNNTVGERMLLNAAFLIDKQNEAAFDAKVNEWYEHYKGKADFKYTGPWPAYNFVNIRLRIEESG